MSREPERRRVFVYGSLLSGEPNHPVIERAEFVGAAMTPPRFTLHDLGAFPAMIEGGEHAIVGEVYEVDQATLTALDRLEGHPRFYRRMPIALADGSSAETYVLTRAQVVGRPVVSTGSWRAHRKARLR